jgi:hypothetical protein
MMMDTRSKEYWDLKRDISVIILHHVADKLGMTFEDYCSVYDSEQHESMLNDIMKKIMEPKL